MHAAEDATRFLHHACRGLPSRLNGSSRIGSSPDDTRLTPSLDVFYTRVIEYAVAYFGSRVLYPSRPAPAEDSPALSRTAVERAAQAALRGDTEEFHSAARNWGYIIGSDIYRVYLAGKVKPGGLRRLFLAHLDKPGAARKVCTAVIARLRSATR